MVDLKQLKGEEILLYYAVLNEFNKYVMSQPLVDMRWRMRALMPNDPGVKSLQNYTKKILEIQLLLGEELIKNNIPHEVFMKIPISKEVFQSLTEQKKLQLLNLIKELCEDLGDFKFFGNQALALTWNKIAK